MTALSALPAPEDVGQREIAPSASNRSRAAQTVRRDLRIESYLALAEQFAQSARGASLPQVREKHELAASRWRQLAEMETDISPPPRSPTPGAGRPKLA